MRGVTTMLLLALVCGVWRGAEGTTAKHFETLYSWSEIDYEFPDPETRAAMISDYIFVPGAAVPMDMAVDSHTGRIFVSTTKFRPGIPYSLSTVSETKNAKDERLLLPYPDYSSHSKCSGGITSAEAMTIDECGRLWVTDMGSEYVKGDWEGHSKDCPTKLLVFDLKTNQLIKEYKFPLKFVKSDSSLSNIAVEVVSTDNECRNTFAYIADTAHYHLIVYDFAHDDAWTVEANAMYPDPDFGHYHYNGVHFDAMFGIHGMALTPKHEGEDRILYFNSFASGKDSYVATSLLKNKTYFAEDASQELQHYVYSHIHTYPELRPGGQACMGPIFNGVMFYGSHHESSIYCWNHKTAYTHGNLVEVDKDETAFDSFMKFTVATRDGGVPRLYTMTNSLEKFRFADPDPNEIHFRIMRAPIEKLIEGTPCAGLVTT